MPTLTLQQIQAGTGGIILSGRNDGAFTRFTIDSRAAGPGDFFFAIKGRSLDGHDFLSDAVSKGARGLAAHRDMDELRLFPAVIMVKDTTRALQDLASWVRRQSDVTVIGVTGTTGKTTTKDFIAALLGKHVLKSEGNLNNQYGLPLSLLRLQPKQSYAVLEMGMSTPGEIASLCQISAPSVGVVTNISPVHLETMGSIRNVALAKAELLDALPRDGLAVINGDDPWVVRMSRRFKGRILSYGFQEHNRYRAARVRFLGVRGMSFTLVVGSRRFLVTARVIGKHALANLLAAVAVADGLGVPIPTVLRRIPSVRPAGLRGEIVKLPNGALVLNDAYNSNPRALRAAVEMLAGFPCRGRRVLVAGDMLELGGQSRALHAQAGRFIGSQKKIAMLITVGPQATLLAEGARRASYRGEIQSFRNAGDAAAFLKTHAQRGDVILVKGSRGIALERAIEALKEPL